MDDIKARAVDELVSSLHDRLHIECANLRAVVECVLEKYDLSENISGLGESNLKANIEYYINVKTLDGLSKRSLHRYEEELFLFARYIDKSVAYITITDIRQYFASIQREKMLKKTTLNNKISIIRNFFVFLHAEEIITKNPAAKLKNLKVDVNSLREALSIEDLELIRNACQDIREKVIIEFFFSTGGRLSEISSARVSTINWAENALVVHGKGDKDRTVYFSVKCRVYLREYLKTRKGESDYLLIGERYPYDPLKNSGLERAVRRIAVRAGISVRVSPHVLRHTFATLALQRGMSLHDIQRLLGHSTIATTQIYAKSNDKMVKSSYEQYVAI
jgi:Site-specific recombinase XerD